MEFRITLNALISVALWIVGVSVYAFIVAGYLPTRYSGLALVPLIAGSVIHVHALIRGLCREERIAGELREFLMREVRPGN